MTDQEEMRTVLDWVNNDEKLLPLYEEAGVLFDSVYGEKFEEGTATARQFYIAGFIEGIKYGKPDLAAAALAFKWTFGKFKGKTIGEILQECPFYLGFYMAGDGGRMWDGCLKEAATIAYEHFYKQARQNFMGRARSRSGVNGEMEG